MRKVGESGIRSKSKLHAVDDFIVWAQPISFRRKIRSPWVEHIEIQNIPYFSVRAHGLIDINGLGNLTPRFANPVKVEALIEWGLKSPEILQCSDPPIYGNGIGHRLAKWPSGSHKLVAIFAFQKKVTHSRRIKF